MVDRAENRSKRSLADQTCSSIIEDYLSAGLVKAGELLPSEKELADRYRVSRVTLRSAIRSLSDRGLVSVRNGIGAMVLPVPPASSLITHHLDRLTSLDRAAQELGKRLDTEDLLWGETVVTPEVSQKLRLPVGDPVYFAKRCRTLDGVRVVWTVDWWPAGLVEGSKLKEEFHGSVLDAMLLHENLGLTYADLEITPTLLSVELAECLHVQPGALSLYLDTVVFGAAGRPDLWGQIWALPEHFRFFLRRQLNF